MIQHFLFIFTLFLVYVQSLKLSQVGKNDWNFQNIGAIIHASIKYDKIYFLSEKKLYGSLSKINGIYSVYIGNIISRTLIDQS